MHKWKAYKVHQAAVSFVNVNFRSTIKSNILMNCFNLSIRHWIIQCFSTINKSKYKFDSPTTSEKDLRENTINDLSFNKRISNICEPFTCKI